MGYSLRATAMAAPKALARQDRQAS
jgi:hypothetical protein